MMAALITAGVIGVGTWQTEQEPALLTSLSQAASHPSTGSEAFGPTWPSPPSTSASNGPATPATPANAGTTPRSTPGSGRPTTRPTTRARTAAPRRRTPARAAAVGLTAAAQQLTDLPYANVSAAQKLDLYLPQRNGTAVPLLIDIHGGAFMGGAKSEAGGRINALVEHGYAVASINYRLSGEAHFPAGMKDVKAAIRWLRASAPRYGIDPNRFAAWGDSAGGYFAAMLGATSGVTTSFDDATLGNAKVSSAVQAVVDFYGPVDFLTMDQQNTDPGGCPQSPQVHNAADSPESLWLGSPVQSVAAVARTANPITYLGRGNPPPFFVAHGTADCLVPQGQTLELLSALRARGIRTTSRLLPGVGHGASTFDEQLQSPVLTFLDSALGHA
jgi:acetyl esterase/lipase